MTTIEILESQVDYLIIAMQKLMAQAGKHKDCQCCIEECQRAIEQAQEDSY